MKNRQFFATRSATANLVILSGFHSHRFLSIWQSYGHKSGVSHFVTCVHLALYHKAIIAAWQLDPRSFSSYSFFDITFLSHFYSPGGGATVKSRQFCQIYVAITVTLLCYPDSRSQIQDSVLNPGIEKNRIQDSIPQYLVHVVNKHVRVFL